MVEVTTADGIEEIEEIEEEDFKPLFIEEAQLRLMQMNGDLLALEQDSQNNERLESLFRSAHTLKTGAMMVGFDNFAHVAHRLEDILSEMRSSPALVSAALVDLLLKALDGLSNFLVSGDDRDVVALLSQPEHADIASLLAKPSTPATQKSLAPALAASIPMSIPALPASEASGFVTVTATAAIPNSLPLAPSPLDDTLPLIDEAVAAQQALGSHFADPNLLPAYRLLTLRLRQLQDSALTTRMVAAGTLFPILHRGAREVSHSTGKDVHWEASGEGVLLDRAILDTLRDPLLQIVRNAVVHGVEADRSAAGKPAAAKVEVEVSRSGSSVSISVRDDGGGINLDRVRSEAIRKGIDTSASSNNDLINLLFQPGFSTAPVLNESAGRGIGLDIVAAAVSRVRGQIQIKTGEGGTEFRIVVPHTLAVVPCTIVQIGQQRFGLPSQSVLGLDGGLTMRSIPLGSLLGLTFAVPGPKIVLTDASRHFTFEVDSVIGKREVIVRPLRGPLPPLDILTGVGLNPDGSILIILNASALITRAFGCALSPSAQ